MELRHLRYFLAVAEEENATRAARRLHVSQPALSRQIKDLEDELGFSLLERGAKSLRLTEAGRVFLVEVRAVLIRLEEAIHAARSAAGGGAETLRIGYAPSPTARLLPATLRVFNARLPSIKVRLHDLSTQEMLNQLHEGKLDMAFIVQPRRALLRGLRFEAIMEDPLRLAVSPKHELATRSSVRLTDMAKFPLVVLSRQEYPDYHEMLESLFQVSKLKPKIVEEHDGVTSLIAAVEAGQGIAVVSESLGCIAGPRLRLMELAPAVAPLVVGAAWQKMSPRAAAAQFLQSAQEAAAAQRPAR